MRSLAQAACRKLGSRRDGPARFRDASGTCRSSSAERPPLARAPCRTLGNRQACRRRLPDASGTCICRQALSLHCHAFHVHADDVPRHDHGGNARNGSRSSSFPTFAGQRLRVFSVDTIAAPEKCYRQGGCLQPWCMWCIGFPIGWRSGTPPRSRRSSSSVAAIAWVPGGF